MHTAATILKYYGIRELRSTLQKIWNDLPQKSEARAVQNIHKRLQMCVDKSTLNISYGRCFLPLQ